jgi:uncharacterized protein (TIGR03086 family)
VLTTATADQLSLAIDFTGQLIATVREEQWAGPTPCTDWSVRDLVAHLVAGNNLFVSALHVGQPPAAPAAPTAPTAPTAPRGTVMPGADLLTAYRDSAAELLGAFREPGALDRIVTVPFGTVPGIVALHLRITEFLVHGWDLARATGQPAIVPDGLAEQELAFSRSKLADIPPGRRPFAPPQPTDDLAPAIDQLAACLGRDITPHAAALETG